VAAGGARVEAAFSPGSADALERTLRDGLESRITFTVRFYERRTGLSAIFGDALLDERRVSRVAFYDTLAGRYVVEQDSGAAAYPDGASLADGFFMLRGLGLDAAEDSGRARYVAARVLYDPVRLSPPLTILTLFGVAARVATPWVRRDVAAAPAADTLP
jgi:hypothetical protein